MKSFGNGLRIGGGAEYLKFLSFVPGLFDEHFSIQMPLLAELIQQYGCVIKIK